jgi:VWFA-related protein
MNGLGLLFVLAALAETRVPRFSSGTDQVRLDVAVSRGADPIAGLGAEDFEVRDNGARQDVALVSREERAVHAVLVLDLSSSLLNDDRDKLKAAAASFLGKLEPNDHATLLTFTHDLRLASGPTAPSAAQMQVKKLGGFGSTALYDAVYAGMTVAGAAPGRPFVLVFTDGLNYFSWLGATQLLDVARGLEPTVYVVSTGEWPDSEDVVRRVVRESGGQLWHGRSIERLSEDFDRVLAEVKNRYLLVYDVPGTPQPGWHEIKVKLRRGKAQVRARRGYFVGRQP